MSDELGHNSFDDLVAGISSEERQFLLSKLNQTQTGELPILQPIREETETIPLEQKLRSESVLYLFILWIRSIFTKKEKTQLYNEDLIASLARRVNKNHPGIIDHPNGLLLSLFFEKVKELKNSAEFFKPYFAMINDNPGKFYVFLSAFVSPEISEQVSKEADPYTIPFSREGSVELRSSLLRKLDGILKDMLPDSRARLYDCVKCVDWLKRFTELPYTHFLAQFTNVASESFSCPYTNAQVDFPAFASVLEDARSIPNEVLQSIFLFTQRRGTFSDIDPETERASKEYLMKATSSISMIQMFISTVPLGAIGKVIFADYGYQTENSGGSEDWFIKFKEEWKVIFDQRWEAWLRDRKKAQLAAVLKEKFKISSFPELPYRPWTKVWGGLVFRCEMTGGFLYWYAQHRYSFDISILNIILLEGMFVNNENRAELSEALNDFADVNQRVLEFASSLAPQGTIGNVFEKILLEPARTVRAQQSVDSALTNAEVSVRGWEQKFCSSCRKIENILHGILDDVKDRNYEPIQNLMTIRGRDNHEFRDNLVLVRDEINECKRILSEIEPLDLPKKDSRSSA